MLPRALLVGVDEAGLEAVERELVGVAGEQVPGLADGPRAIAEQAHARQGQVEQFPPFGGGVVKLLEEVTLAQRLTGAAIGIGIYFTGLTIGGVGAGILIEYGPYPRQLAFAVALVLIIALGIIFRVDVVRLWPRTASAYAGVGLPVNSLGLVIEGVRFEPSLQDGHAALAAIMEPRMFPIPPSTTYTRIMMDML